MTRLVALKNCQLNTGCRTEKLPSDHGSFSQCYVRIPKIRVYHLSFLVKVPRAGMPLLWLFNGLICLAIALSLSLFYVLCIKAAAVIRYRRVEIVRNRSRTNESSDNSRVMKRRNPGLMRVLMKYPGPDLSWDVTLVYLFWCNETHQWLINIFRNRYNPPLVFFQFDCFGVYFVLQKLQNLNSSARKYMFLETTIRVGRSNKDYHCKHWVQINVMKYFCWKTGEYFSSKLMCRNR